MFTEQYFTEKDARTVQALLSLFFPITFTVKYVGIYGKLGTPGQFVYAVTFQGKWRAHQLSRLGDLEKWLSDELDTMQAQQIICLLRAWTKSPEVPS